jgi:shikimate kinase
MNNISLIGMAGCGKSTVGSAISEKFNLSYIDTDHLIEKKFQMTLEDIKNDLVINLSGLLKKKSFLVLILQHK